MEGVVEFDPAAFRERYPQFSGASDGVLNGMFDEATLVVNNTPQAFVRDLRERRILLWLVVAHIATLAGINLPGGEGGKSTVVGRLSSATEGSVSTSFDMGQVSSNAAWWLQTQYGATYWQMILKYRSMRYVPPAHRCNRGYVR